MAANPTVALGNVVDELHDKHSLAHTSAAKEANLATTLVGSKQIHHLKCTRLLSGSCGQNHDTSAIKQVMMRSTHTPAITLAKNGLLSAVHALWTVQGEAYMLSYYKLNIASRTPASVQSWAVPIRWAGRRENLEP